MADDITQFFDQFAEDFAHFDGSLIATRYCAPYTAVSADGEIKLFSDSEAIGRYFQVLLDDYRAQAIVSCRHHSLHSESVSDMCTLATMNWEMLSSTGKVVSSWRESYNLLKNTAQLEPDHSFKIFTSMDH